MRNSFRNFLATGSVLATGSLLIVSACSGQSGEVTTPPSASSSTGSIGGFPAGLRLILAGPHAPVNDTFEVFICDVPLDTTDAIYGRLTLRLDLTPQQLSAKLNDNVTPYFEALSHGKYHPRFVAGDTLSMSSDEPHDHCVERAIDASRADTTAVMVVASAEHLENESGGWGRPGSACDTRSCPATRTRRALYVGASDFHPDWGAVPAVDLTEHEIGHTLGLPHSGDPASDDQHASDIDLMSNSASPRNTNPDRRNGPDTLAVNRLALGWLSADDLIVAPVSGGTFTLSPSTGARGLRVLVLPQAHDAHGGFLTVEYLTADGFNDFLPMSGLAVHSIEQAGVACPNVSDTGPPESAICTGSQRVQATLGSASPHLELLSLPGSSWVLEGWTITVDELGQTAQVEVRPVNG